MAASRAQWVVIVVLLPLNSLGIDSRNGMSYNGDSFRKFVWEKVKTQGTSYIGGFWDRNLNTRLDIRVFDSER